MTIQDTPPTQYLIETDVLADFLVAQPNERTLLRDALTHGVCYTTMLQAFELFRATASEEQQQSVLDALMIVRVLGFNARVAQPFATLANDVALSGATLTDRDAMTLAMAQASKLTILTRTKYATYASANVVKVVSEVGSEQGIGSNKILGQPGIVEASDGVRISAVAIRSSDRAMLTRSQGEIV